MAELTKKYILGVSVFTGWCDPLPYGADYHPWAANDTAHDVYIGNTALFPDRKPSVAKFGGYYDETSQAVWDAIIDDTKGTIDFFSFDWYCNPSTSTLYLNHGIDKFRTSSKKADMQFCVNWINDTLLGAVNGYTLAQFDWAIGQIISYFSDSSYLIKNGKPVLIIYSTAEYFAIAGMVYSAFPTALYRGEWLPTLYNIEGVPTFISTYSVNDYIFNSPSIYRCTTAHTASGSFDASKFTAVVTSPSNVAYGAGSKYMVDHVRALVKAAGYTDVYLVACTAGTPFDSGDYGHAALGGFDAITTYNYQAGQINFTPATSGGTSTLTADRFGLVTSGGAPDYAEMDWTYRCNWHNAINLTTICKYWVPGLNGWDNRPWTAPANRYPTLTTAAAKHNGNCRPKWNEWRNHLIAMLEQMDNTARTDGFGLLYALTEHAEGGFLLSTEQDGRTALNIIDQVFNVSSAPVGTERKGSSTKAVVRHDGSANGYVLITDNAALQITNKFTLMIRLRCANTAPNAYVCGRVNGGSSLGYAIFLNTNADGALDPGIFVGNTLLQTTSRSERNLNAGEAVNWHHYAATFDGTLASGSREAKMYVDGILRTSRTNLTTTLTAPAGTNFLVGRRSNDSGGTAFVNGWTCDLRLYNRVLSAAEILAAKQGKTVDATSLIISMPMDEGANATINSVVSGAGNGALGTAAKWITKGQCPSVMPYKR